MNDDASRELDEPRRLELDGVIEADDVDGVNEPTDFDGMRWSLGDGLSLDADDLPSFSDDVDESSVNVHSLSSWFESKMDAMMVSMSSVEDLLMCI